MSAPRKHITGYRTVGIAQAAEFVYRLVAERDANKRAKLAGHALLLLSDADKAIGEIAGIVAANEQYHTLLRLVEEAGITMLSADPETPLSLPVEVGA